MYLPLGLKTKSASAGKKTANYRGKLKAKNRRRVNRMANRSLGVRRAPGS